MTARPPWTPDEARKWLKVLADVACYGCAVFLIVYGALHAVRFGLAIVTAMFAAAMTLLGVPPLLRIDRRRNGDEE